MGRDGHERPGPRRQPGPAGPMPGSGPQPAADCQQASTPGQLHTYKLTVRVIAELYPAPTNERRWAFQNAIASSRGRPLIRTAELTGQIGVRDITVTRVAPAS